MNKFFTWLSSKSLAHLFAITRHLDSEVARLRSENEKLNQELAAQRQQFIEKIYQAVGLAESQQTVNTQGVPLELIQTEVKSTQPITDLIRRAEQEDWIAWQEEERRRLAHAKLISTEFHDLNA